MNLLQRGANLGTWKVPEIMATIGPTLEKLEDLRRAIEAGARWVRLPCGYRQRPHVENARAARAAAIETGPPIQLLLDLPSSRPRTGTMQDSAPVGGGQSGFLGSREPPAERPEKMARGRCRCPVCGSWSANWLQTIACGFAMGG